MRLPDWDSEKIKENKAAWQLCKGASEGSAYELLAILLAQQPENPVQADLLRSLCGSNNRRRAYSSFSIAKKRGGERIISVPSPALRWVQRALLQTFSHLARPHRCALGFVRKQSVVIHAQLHSSKKLIFTIDIEDFFPSISWARIYGMLKASPFEASPTMARIIANLTCYNNALPQGAPTSPLLANLVCRKLDSRLFSWAKEKGYNYSRYADDLAFSTNKTNFPQPHQDEIKKIIIGEGFKINSKKTRLIGQRQRQLVTGLVVNKKPNVTREYLRNLRALLHNVKVYGWDSQISRGQSLKTKEEYDNYLTHKLSLKDLNALQENQRDNNFLINPSARILKAFSVQTLQRVVWGRVDYVGQVKGRESEIFIKLREQCEQLIKQIPGEEKEDISKVQVSKQDKETIKKIKAVRDIPQLRQLLREWQDKIVEFSWELPSDDEGNIEELRKRTAVIFFSAARDPRATAQFFRFFDKNTYFEGMLHGPTVGNISFKELLINCKQVFSAYRSSLPNSLQDRVAQFLKASENELLSHPDMHLWDVQDFRDKYILPFKRLTRFDSDAGDSTILEKMLGDFYVLYAKQEKRKLPSLEIDLKNRKIYTDVSFIQEGLKLILESMLNNSISEKITITSEPIYNKETALLSYSIKITDPTAIIQKEPQVSLFFGGKLKGALKFLRGFADWSITANFKDENSYQFDIMSNKVTSLAISQAGISHKLTLFRYTS